MNYLYIIFILIAILVLLEYGQRYLKKQKEICIWLDTLFPTFDPITQIALRQLFPYARYLLTK